MIQHTKANQIGNQRAYKPLANDFLGSRWKFRVGMKLKIYIIITCLSWVTEPETVFKMCHETVLSQRSFERSRNIFMLIMCSSWHTNPESIIVFKIRYKLHICLLGFAYEFDLNLKILSLIRRRSWLIWKFLPKMFLFPFPIHKMKRTFTILLVLVYEKLRVFKQISTFPFQINMYYAFK